METPEPDLVHATGCKHPSLRLNFLFWRKLPCLAFPLYSSVAAIVLVLAVGPTRSGSV
jgi:hypothetical protein